MWVFTKKGFMSVVEMRDDVDKVMIRFRCKEDAEAIRMDCLSTKGDDFSLPDIIKTEEADYRYRIIVDRVVLVELMTTMVSELDYHNFKNAVHGDVDRDIAYMGVWGEMSELQTRKEGEYNGIATYIQTEEDEERDREQDGYPWTGDNPCTRDF